MKITFLALSAACAALTIAEAVPAPLPHEDGPKYYFPRVVKRQTEANITSPTTTPQTASPFADSSGSSTSATQDNGGLGDALSSIVSSVVGDLATTPASQSTTSPGIIIGLDTVITNVGTPTSTGSSPTSSGGDSLGDDSTPPPTTTTPTLGDALASALDDLTAVASTTTPFVSGTPVGDPTTFDDSQQSTNGPTAPIPTTTPGNLISSLSNVIDSLTSGPLDLPTTTPGPTASLPDASVTTPNVFPTTQPPPDSTVGPTNGGTTTPPSPTDQPTQPPSTPLSTTGEPVSPPTDAPTSEPPPPPVVNNSTNTEPLLTPTPLATPFSPSESPVAATTPPPTSEAPQSIVPTGTDNATAVIPPSNIETAPAVPTSESTTNTSPSAIPTTLPSDVPRVITPEGGIPVAPENSTLIQIAFKEPLHYEFVVGSQLAVSQIFTYLPEGIADGLDVGQNKVVMQYLQPYNTLAKLHYITTLCMGYVPSTEVDKLSMELLNMNSALYNNPNKSVKTLMDMIDPSVPLLAGQGLSPGGTPVNTPDGTATENNNGEADAPGGGDGSSGVKPSSVGIAVGAVAGAAVYGAAMFLVARRYKKRKAAHQRASSVQTDEPPRAGEATNLMTGARNSYGSRLPGRNNSNNGRGSRNSDRSDESGRSGRTYISPPVMAENSLGWN